MATIPLTLDYMRSIVLSYLDDTDFETTFLDQALNEAQWDITNNHSLNFLETSLAQTMAINDFSVLYPTDAREILSVRITPPGAQSYDITENYIDYATYEDQQTLPGVVGQPFKWTTFGGKILLGILVDKAYVVTIKYLRTSPRVDGITTFNFDIPYNFQELLKLGAFMRIAKRETDYDVKSQESIDYNKQLIDLIHAYSRNVGPRKKHVMRVMGR